MKNIIRILTIASVVASTNAWAQNSDQVDAISTANNTVKQQDELAQAEKLKTADELPIESEFDNSSAKRIDKNPLNIIESVNAPEKKNFQLIYVNLLTHPEKQNRQTLHANATVKTIEQDEEKIRLALALSEINNKVESTRAETTQEELDPIIVYWTINKDGEFLEVDLLGLPQESPLNVIEKILTSMSYSVTKSLQEKEVNGFAMEYAFRYDANEEILWKKAEAIDFEARRDLGYEVNRNDAKGKFILDENGFFDEAIVIENIAFTITNKPATLETKLKFKAADSGASIAIPDTELAADYNRPEGYVETEVETAKALEIEDQSQLQELFETKEEWDFFEVKAVGEYLSEQGYSALQALLANDLSAKDKSHIFAGLQASGTPESQAVLVAASQDPSLNDDDRMRAILALGKIEKPTDESISALQNLTSGDANDITNTAYLNLGLVSQNLENEKREEVLQFLSNRLNASSGSSDQEWVVLNSLNNAGENAANDTVRNYFDSEDTRLRAVAAKILLKDEDYVEETMNHVTSNDEMNYEVVAEVRKNLKPSMIKTSHLDQLENAFNTAASYDKLTIERFKLYAEGAQSLGQIQQRRQYVRDMMDKVKGPKFTIEAIKFITKANKLEEQAQQEALENLAQ